MPLVLCPINSLPNTTLQQAKADVMEKEAEVPGRESRKVISTWKSGGTQVPTSAAPKTRTIEPKPVDIACLGAVGAVIVPTLTAAPSLPSKSLNSSSPSPGSTSLRPLFIIRLAPVDLMDPCDPPSKCDTLFLLIPTVLPPLPPPILVPTPIFITFLLSCACVRSEANRESKDVSKLGIVTSTVGEARLY